MWGGCFSIPFDVCFSLRVKCFFTCVEYDLNGMNREREKKIGAIGPWMQPKKIRSVR